MQPLRCKNKKVSQFLLFQGGLIWLLSASLLFSTQGTETLEPRAEEELSVQEKAESESIAAELGKKLEVSLKAMTFARFFILSPLSREIIKPLGERLEAAYKEVTQTLHASEPLLERRKKCMVLILPDRRAYEKYVDLYAAEQHQPRDHIQVMKRTRGFYNYNPPMTVDYVALRPFREVEASIIHKLGHILIYRFHFQYNYIPPWLSEGFAVYVEGKFLGEVLTFCISSRKTRYEDPPAGQGIKEKWLEFGSWPGLLRTMVSARKDAPLRTLVGSHINDLGYQEVAKSWSIIQFLLEKHGVEFIEFLKRLRKALPNYEAKVTPQDYRAIQEGLFLKIFGKSMEEIEEEWRGSIVPAEKSTDGKDPEGKGTPGRDD